MSSRSRIADRSNSQIQIRETIKDSQVQASLHKTVGPADQNMSILVCPTEVLYQALAWVFIEYIQTMFDAAYPDASSPNRIVSLLLTSREIRAVTRIVISDSLGMKQSDGGQ